MDEFTRDLIEAIDARLSEAQQLRHRFERRRRKAPFWPERAISDVSPTTASRKRCRPPRNGPAVFPHLKVEPVRYDLAACAPGILGGHTE